MREWKLVFRKVLKVNYMYTFYVKKKNKHPKVPTQWQKGQFSIFPANSESVATHRN